MQSKPSLLLLASAFLVSCVSVGPPPGQGMVLRDTSRTAQAQARAQAQDGRAHAWASSSSPVPVRRQSASETRQALLDALSEVRGSTRALAGTLSKLGARQTGIGGEGGAFNRYVVHGTGQLRWVEGTLNGATTLADVARDVDEPDMEAALLRMSGPRLQAGMSGAVLLAAWVDFLNLADAVLQKCPAYSAERLFRDMHRVQMAMEPSMRALASLEPGQVEAAAAALPELMGQLTREFQSIHEGARVATERAGHAIAAAQFVEMLTLFSTMKLSFPRMPPAAPATFGVGLVMGSNGVMLGSQVVVSTEWVEMIRRLVQAGVLSASAASAAVRIHAGVVMANSELPKGVRDALGDGPEVRGMRETGKAGAGMSDAPLHHVFPQSRRAWFEERGFTGDMSIDQFCVRLEEAHHQAIHGGGNWRLGRMWPNEWNRMIMEALFEAEVKAGRMLKPHEILKLVASRMRRYDIRMNFTPGRGR